MSSPTQSTSTQLTESELLDRLSETAFNRAVTHIRHRDAVESHHKVRAEHLDQTAATLEQAPLRQLLADLRTAGLLWSTVASIVGVSDTAVRKWRKDASIDAAHLRRIARLCALKEHFERFSFEGRPDAFGVWLHSPVVDGFSCTPAQLLELTRARPTAELQPLIDFMLREDGHLPEAMLDTYLGEQWRDDAAHEERFEIVRDDNGDRVLVVND